jgi:predicted nucleotidyltransferase
MVEAASLEPISEELFMLDSFGLIKIEDRFFREAIRCHVSEYHAHFGERLVSVYVFGSVHRNEAIPEVSDLDLHAFIVDTFTEADQQHLNKVSGRLTGEFPGTHGLIRPRSLDYLLEGAKPEADENARTRTQAIGFRLHYDGTLVFGRDLTDLLKNIPSPDKSYARGYFSSVWELARYAGGIETENKTDFSLPHEPARRLRKLARLGVLSGACLLMAKGRFQSFRGTDILPAIGDSFPEWGGFLDKTRRFYIHITEPTNHEMSEYLSQLVEWVDWVKSQLE